MSVRGLWSGTTYATCEKVMCVVEGAHGAQIIEHALTASALELPSQRIPVEIARRIKSTMDIDFTAKSTMQPKILIGQDNWRLIETSESKRIAGTGLVLSNSRLGWVLHGYMEESREESCNVQIHAICCAEGAAELEKAERIALADIDEQVRRYFALENLGVEAPKKKNHNEDRATKILRETTRKVGKTWETGLLWKRDTLPKLDTKATALKRLRALERKLDRDPETAAAYYREIDRFIENGYAVKVKRGANSLFKRYISHFYVKNINKPGKTRPVFDSAEPTNGVSMNDLLDAGPDLLQSLVGVLLRFREHPFAVKADIKDMYLRIKVIERDQAAQHFLYRGADRRREPDEYVMTCLIFGSKSSPCSALYVKNRNAEEFASSKPEAARSIERNSYMDDYLASGKSVAEMRKLVNDVKYINGEANFEMHGWAANNPEIVKDVREENQLGKQEKVNLCDDEERVLGLFWDRFSDGLSFNVGLKKREIHEDVMKGVAKPTKREFTKIVMSVYDPLGILSPFLVSAKIIMQDIWRSGVRWDAKIRDEEFEPWRAWLKNLWEMRNCSVPRCFVAVGAEYRNVQLHVFCDASLQAYATAAYLRTESHDGKIYLSLVMAKNRVAPVKPTTVPRLELQAAVLGTRLAATISKELDITISEKIYWSDSTTVLQWIRAGPRLKQIFVRNRLGEIGEKTSALEWRWVPTQLNPADDATRPSKAPMLSTDRWLVGPTFLREPAQNWPKEKALKATEAREIDELESRGEFIGTATANIESTPVTGQLLGWYGLIKLAGRLRYYVNRWSRFVAETKGVAATRRTERRKTFREVRQEAAQFWYREIQATCFPEERNALQHNKPIHRGSKLINLRPFLDEDGVMRARGRVRMVGDEEITYDPIILDARHFATKLLIEAYHRRFFHANNEAVVNEMRQEFYIIGLRRKLRSLAMKCTTCRLRRAKPQNPPMADLPRCRVAYHQRPFSQCGVDYFGPMIVKIGRRHEKRWGVLFTCMTTRAIHLELANSLDANSAIMAIQRLACRRGFPRAMYSDNGTNFIKAEKELKEAHTGLDNEKVEHYGDTKGFEWHFNPPDAPHMGGAWERQIRSVKNALYHTLKTQVPSEEVLLTLLLEIEHMVNSRPLTHVSVDPNDEEALTPNHFLIGTSSGHLRVDRYESEILSPRRNFELVQLMARAFWKRWLREYLPTLLPNKKSHSLEPPLQVGDIVLIVDYQAPRNAWRKGKIIEVYPNAADGIVRVVKVRAGKSILVRPAHKLIKIYGTE